MVSEAKVCALLSWYDESPLWLAATVGSLAGVADHLVAVDGAYALFPGGEPRSPVEQHEAIIEAAAAARIGLTLHVPIERWAGNEVEKRNATVELARQVADEDWWLLVIDADMVVTRAHGIRQALAAVAEDVAAYQLVSRDDPHRSETVARYARESVWQKTGRQPLRGLYRALPHLRYDEAHYIVRADEPGEPPVYLWGREDLHELAPAADVQLELRVEHRSLWRDRERAEQARGYYRVRDELGVEQLREAVAC